MRDAKGSLKSHFVFTSRLLTNATSMLTDPSYVTRVQIERHMRSFAVISRIESKSGAFERTWERKAPRLEGLILNSNDEQTFRCTWLGHHISRQRVSVDYYDQSALEINSSINGLWHRDRIDRVTIYDERFTWYRRKQMGGFKTMGARKVYRHKSRSDVLYSGDPLV